MLRPFFCEDRTILLLNGRFPGEFRAISFGGNDFGIEGV